MGFYESLGVAKRINAAAYYTALGGSLMSAEVVAAMNDASKSFISMHELQLKAGAKIAKLTKNEGAYITTGAAAAIALSILAFRTKGDIPEIQKIINGTAGPSDELRYGYPWAGAPWPLGFTDMFSCVDGPARSSVRFPCCVGDQA
jgi:L-seryl-tRNA(Ser) seleniumtransferase